MFQNLKNYSTEAIKAAVLKLFKLKGEEAARAYRIGLDELEARLGPEALDDWMNTWYK